MLAAKASFLLRTISVLPELLLSNLASVQNGSLISKIWASISYLSYKTLGFSLLKKNERNVHLWNIFFDMSYYSQPPYPCILFQDCEFPTLHFFGPRTRSCAVECSRIRRVDWLPQEWVLCTNSIYP